MACWEHGVPCLSSGRWGIWVLCRFSVPRDLRDAFRPLWVALCEGIAKEPFHLEKNGASPMPGGDLINKQKANRKLLVWNSILITSN